jgi:FAD:protein FMN transferase
MGLAFAGLFSACRSPQSQAQLQRFEFKSAHMGTLFSIVLYATNSASASAAATAAFHKIAELEDIMSDYQADSELNLLCEKPAGRPVPVSEVLFKVLQRSEHISRISHGAFDVTVGPYVRLWRFARKRKVLPTPAEVAAARTTVGWEKVRLDPNKRTVTLEVPGMRLDLGGIAKGYSADQALRELKMRGITRAFVAASGDIAFGDAPPGERGWKVGISGWESALEPCTLILHNAGISTSGDAEQFIEFDGVRYSHIVSPATGLGLTERIQVSIVAPDATATDGLATAVSVMGKVAGLRLIEQESRTAAIVLVPNQGGKMEAFPSKRFNGLPKIAGPAAAHVR